MECPFGAVGTFASAFEGKCGIRHFLHPLVADTGEPELDRFGLGAGNALDEAQQGLGIGDIGESLLAVLRQHFQLVTICYQFTSLSSQAAFEHLPILSRCLIIGLLRQYADDVHD